MVQSSGKMMQLHTSHASSEHEIKQTWAQTEILHNSLSIYSAIVGTASFRRTRTEEQVVISSWILAVGSHRLIGSWLIDQMDGWMDGWMGLEFIVSRSGLLMGWLFGRGVQSGFARSSYVILL